jgi:hypothetical protein
MNCTWLSQVPSTSHILSKLSFVGGELSAAGSLPFAADDGRDNIPSKKHKSMSNVISKALRWAKEIEVIDWENLEVKIEKKEEKHKASCSQ